MATPSLIRQKSPLLPLAQFVVSLLTDRRLPMEPNLIGAGKQSLKVRAPNVVRRLPRPHACHVDWGLKHAPALRGVRFAIKVTTQQAKTDARRRRRCRSQIPFDVTDMLTPRAGTQLPMALPSQPPPTPYAARGLLICACVACIFHGKAIINATKKRNTK